MARAKRPKLPTAESVVERQVKWVLSNEDWYPTIEGRVRVTAMRRHEGTTRVAVWGGDDFGLELDGSDWAAAVREFDRIVNLTTQAELRSRGFIHA